MNQTVISARPDFASADKGRSDGVHDAVTLVLRGIGGGWWIEIRRDAGIFAREIGADRLPGVAAIGGAKDHLSAKIKDVWIERRKYQRQGPGASQFFCLGETRRDVLGLLGAQILASN